MIVSYARAKRVLIISVKPKETGPKLIAIIPTKKRRAAAKAVIFQFQIGAKTLSVPLLFKIFICSSYLTFAIELAMNS